MENRLKERLTGAAILVALIVLLVPEMFRGPGNGAPAASVHPTDGPPMRSYTIDLTNRAGTAPLQATAPATAASAPDSTSAVPPARAVSALPAAAVAAIPEAPATRGPTASAPLANAQLSNPKAPAATAPASRPPVAASPATPGGWTVQLGLFAKRENAERLAHSAQQKGFNVSISGADARGLFHVRSASLADRNAAKALQQRLKSDGFAAAVTGAP